MFADELCSIEDEGSEAVPRNIPLPVNRNIQAPAKAPISPLRNADG